MSSPHSQHQSIRGVVLILLSSKPAGSILMVCCCYRFLCVNGEGVCVWMVMVCVWMVIVCVNCEGVCGWWWCVWIVRVCVDGDGVCEWWWCVCVWSECAGGESVWTVRVNVIQSFTVHWIMECKLSHICKYMHLISHKIYALVHMRQDIW